jgi:WD40 repeat protein
MVCLALALSCAPLREDPLLSPGSPQASADSGVPTPTPGPDDGGGARTDGTPVADTGSRPSEDAPMVVDAAGAAPDVVAPAIDALPSGEEPTCLTTGGQPANATTVAFSSDSRSFVSSAQDGKIRVFSTADGRMLLSLEHRTGPSDRQLVRSVAFSPDGTKILSGAVGGQPEVPAETKLWDAGDGGLLRSFPGQADAALFTPDGRSVVVGNWNGRGPIRVIEILNGQVLRSFGAAASKLALSRDGRVLMALAFRNGHVLDLWQLSDGNLLRSLPSMDLDGPLNALDVSPVDDSVVTGSYKMIELYRQRDFSRIRTMARTGHNLAFSPDGTLLAGGFAVDLIRVADGTLVKTLSKVQTFAVAFSPDGRLLCAAQLFNGVRCWCLR